MFEIYQANTLATQIWFQNRRQNDRRKSRPLSPHELATLRFSGVNGDSSAPINGYSFVTDRSHASEHGLAPYSAAHPTDMSHSSSPLPVAATPGPVARHGQYPNVTPRIGSQEFMDESPILSRSLPGSSVGYLANRWNVGTSYSTPASMKRSTDDGFGPEPFSASARSDGTPCLKRSHSQSQIRLALSLEGKAQLVSNEESPTREVPQRPSSTTPIEPTNRGLKRSYSALPTVTLPPISALTGGLPPRLGRGRSRDVQAWESCADADKRDELAAQAEHESNGSAIAAISLLRSSSGILQSSASKRNTPVGNRYQDQYSSPVFKKPRLSRTNSSIGRLEHNGKENDLDAEKFSAKVKVSALLMSPTDSDKENLSPDEDGNARERGIRRQPVKSHNARRLGRVLQSAESPKLLPPRGLTSPLRKGGSDAIEIFEDSGAEPAREKEVERFMTGNVSPSKKPDMDCIAGLLSLSQGAWR